MIDYEKIVECTIKYIQEDIMDCRWRLDTDKSIDFDDEEREYLETIIETHEETLQMIEFYRMNPEFIKELL